MAAGGGRDDTSPARLTRSIPTRLVESLAGRIGGHLDRSETTDHSTAVILLAGAVAAAVLSPVAWLGLRAVSTGVQGLATLTEPSLLEVLANSIALTVAVTAGSLVVGVPLAVLTVQTNLPFRRLWTVVLSLPLVVPSYVGAFAFVSAFGPRGTLADLLAPVGISTIPTIYGFFGTTLVLTLYIYPYVFLTTRAALIGVDGRMIDAARTLGDSRWSAFRRVTLPQIAPGILAGALLVALYALSDFGTPAIMHLDVFTRQIYIDFQGGFRDRAALLSMELLAVTAVILAIETRLTGGDPEAYVSHAPGGASEIRMGYFRWVAFVAVALVAGIALLLPLGVLVHWLVRSGPGYAGAGFDFQLEYGMNSVYVSLLAAAAATVAALPVAYAATRRQSSVARIAERATWIGYAVPGIVLGLALVFFAAGHAAFLYQTIPLLVFAYVVRFLPQSVGAIGSSLVQVNPTLVEAARTLGESPMRVFRRVTLPLVTPGIIAGAALVFLTTMKELPATLLLHPTEFTTLVTYIWLVQGAGYYGQAAMPALALVGISAVSMLVILAQERHYGE